MPYIYLPLITLSKVTSGLCSERIGLGELQQPAPKLTVLDYRKAETPF